MEDRSLTGESRPGIYTVRRQDTLYSIAWRYNFEYKALARANGIAPPYVIQPGQRIRLTVSAPPRPQPGQPPTAPAIALPSAVSPSAGMAPAMPSDAVVSPPKPTADRPAPPKPTAEKPAPPKPAAAKPRAAKPSVPTPQAAATVAPSAWQRPVSDTPVRGFGDGSKGFDYALAPATRIRAAAGGEVVYAGPGLGGFRHLVIIKASERHLFAYGVDVAPKLAEGDAVETGDIVAEIDSGDADTGRFHFEVRDRGKPVDPSVLIGK